MTTASQKTVQFLEQIVKFVPVGTNLALLQLMWAMITGSFLTSRGAIHSALARSGFKPGEIRRSWRALRWGKWNIYELVQRFRQQVEQTGQWQTRIRWLPACGRRYDSLLAATAAGLARQTLSPACRQNNDQALVLDSLLMLVRLANNACP